jgi:hypothetical protein
MFEHYEEQVRACTVCGKPFPRTAEYFHRNAQAPDGMRPECKTCKRQRRRRDYLANSDTALAQKRAYRAKFRNALGRLVEELRAAIVRGEVGPGSLAHELVTQAQRLAQRGAHHD